MKIVLISSNTATSPYPVYPLGMSMIAAGLRSAGHDVLAFDLLQESQSAIVAAVETASPALIGISIRNIDNVNLLNEKRYIPAVRELVVALRPVSKAPILLGGAGFSILPERILEETGADYGIVGEGEQLVVEFVAALERGELPETRCLRNETLLTGNSIRPAWYQPTWMEHYHRGGSPVGIQSKRGCIHHCLYCTYPYLEGRDIRPRAATEVVDEIEQLIADFNIPQYHFTDSVFNDDQGNYIGVVEEIARRGIKLPWTAFFKPGNLTRPIVTMMKEAGLHAAELGSDATTNLTLRKMGKSFRWEEIDEANELFLNEGVAVAHYFMFGGPGETPETVREGIANIKSLRRSAIFVFMGIRILPGTPLMNLAIKEGVIPADQDMFESVYYVAPDLDRTWLNQTLEQAFESHRNIIFPPDACESAIQVLKGLGYTGPMWELLIREPRPPRQRRANA